MSRAAFAFALAVEGAAFALALVGGFGGNLVLLTAGLGVLVGLLAGLLLVGK